MYGSQCATTVRLVRAGAPAFKYVENSAGHGGVSAVVSMDIGGLISVNTANIVDSDVFLNTLRDHICLK